MLLFSAVNDFFSASERCDEARSLLLFFLLKMSSPIPSLIYPNLNADTPTPTPAPSPGS